MNGKLILARHHESEWNKLGKWTGKRDRHLTDFGFEKSTIMGTLLQDLPIDRAFASMQVRSIETLSCMLNVCTRTEVPTVHSAALNERDYGDYTGKNKWEMEKLLGEAEFKQLRRGWDYPIPHGESLKDVYSRTVPYFLETIMPIVHEGKNTLVVAHGNSLRSMLKYIERIPDEQIVDVEFPFGAIMIYDLDDEGHMLHKQVRQIPTGTDTTALQIVATIGPASDSHAVLESMIRAGVDVIRINFSWGDICEHTDQIKLVRDLEKQFEKKIPIIGDLSGPRIQEAAGHTYDHSAQSALTDRDRECIACAVEQGIDYFAQSFVANAKDVEECRAEVKKHNGTQKVIAKIERAEAVQAINEIIEAADAIMVARGDLGNAVPLEQIPFIQRDIVERCNNAGKPVIVATQMMLSMTNNDAPTRAEVTDVADAILEGADAVMLSEETANGHHPIEASAMMERIVGEARKHLTKTTPIHPL